MSKVTIYTTPSCKFCKKTKRFFKKNDVEYDEHNVAEDKEAREEAIEKSGQKGVPVIDVEGYDDIIVGFDQDKLEEALDI